MGSVSHLKTPGPFAVKFNAFLARVVVEVKGGRLTARWAEKNMPANRKMAYWEKLMRSEQVMTTEDIAIIAEWLGVSPYEFVRAVRDDDVAPFVGGVVEPEVIAAEDEVQLRKAAVDLAAKKRITRQEPPAD